LKGSRHGNAWTVPTCIGAVPVHGPGVRRVERVQDGPRSAPRWCHSGCGDMQMGHAAPGWGRTMSLSLVQSRALVGLQAAAVTVEVHLANGLPNFMLVGLADTEVKEARERVRSAILNCGLDFPHNKRITVNLAPADLPKDSGRLDLPIAIGICSLRSEGQKAYLAPSMRRFLPVNLPPGVTYSARSASVPTAATLAVTPLPKSFASAIE
jgi:hypothetical protein